MRIAIASDHGGLNHKAAIASHLRERGFEVTDLGPESGESVDYPDYAHALCTRLLDGEFDRGVLVCGTGQGMAMSANKHAGLRAAVVSDVFSARMATLHNDAQVLCVGERVVGPGLVLDLVDAWVDAEFEGGRHARRVGKIDCA
ncbi:MAG: ribose 5-phosphate isomerase B [Deltaproteobacteria bacterium]|nr:MAG: ribose 5-phosphate isomerase B [Deltaproteobacteria bacterium]